MTQLFKFSCHTAENNNNKHLTLTADLLQVGHLTIHQRFAELNAAGSADREQICCCLFFFLFLCFVWGFFGPTLFYILMCRRLSQWHFPHASAFRPHRRHQDTHLICQPLSTFPSHWLSSAPWVCRLSLLRPHPRVTL